MSDAEGVKPRHFVDLADFSTGEIESLVAGAKALKARRVKGNLGDYLPLLGKKIALIFQQPSLRTRMSFDVGINELGAHVLIVSGDEIELGHRESIADTARVMSRYVDAIMIRMLSHHELLEMAQYATVPVINGLTKKSHPCQVLADIQTFEERLGSIRGRTIAWTGDSNNVLASWVHAAARLDVKLKIATPEQLSPPAALLDWARAEGAELKLTNDPYEAVDGADCVITDSWVSMGDGDREYRHNLLRPFQVDQRLMDAANKGAIFMHCLPAKRGEEVAAEVIDGPQSAVWDEAENRLHAQKSVLVWALTDTK
ncbi:Ornithine carbamoyltransferase, anabolic [Alphaproteobacteria bacterium SO-S41]|nr:Ornithine carbamoyltransferase, anabolic [Alphaproteobacteria bacterium SO-S41]